MGSQRRVKATIQTQRAVLCHQHVTQTNAIHKGAQDWREERFGIPCSPINAPQDHEMHPCGFIASIKSCRPGNLISSAWCLWIVHGYNFQVQAKNGFQLMRGDGRFSHIYDL